MVSGFRRALDGGHRQSATNTQTEPSRGTIGAPVLTQWEQPETSCPCEVFQPGCRDVRAGQGANSDRSAEQCAHEEWGGYTRLPELSGSLEPCPIPEKSGMQSNCGAGRKDAEQTVLRPTISSDNTPEQEEGHVHGTEMRIRIPRRASGFTRSSVPSPYLATA